MNPDERQIVALLLFSLLSLLAFAGLVGLVVWLVLLWQGAS